MSYNKDEVKEELELEDVFNLLEHFDAEPEMNEDYIVAKTICHGGDSHKLYYYENSGLFRCYTGDCGTFDIFELIQKIYPDFSLTKAIYFVVNFFHLSGRITQEEQVLGTELREDFKNYDKFIHFDDVILKHDKISLPEYEPFYSKYPSVHITPWEQEGITKEVSDYMGVKYDPVHGAILIPHKDENNRLVGVRSRTLLKEQEKYGKYRPATHDGIMYNHPLAFNLYGLNVSKEAIKKTKIAIIAESEKAVMQYLSYFGTSNALCVAVCGSSVSKYQMQLLLELGVNEVAIAFDKDYKELESPEYYQVLGKLWKIHEKYSNKVNISFLFDTEGLLGYKSSPLDHGAKAFLHLWRNRMFF